MKQKNRIAVAATVLALASPGYAVTVSVDWINANVMVNGVSDGSGTRPVATASATSTVTNSGVVDQHKGTAVQNENGFSSLELSVSCEGYEGSACTGGSSEINNRATAIRSITFTNDKAYAQSGIFSFSLSGIEMELFLTDAEASVEFAVGATNGANYRAEMTIWSYYDGSAPVYDILTSDKFAGSIQYEDCFGGFCQKGTIDVDPLSSSIGLGTLDPGESVTVQTTFDIYTVYTATEVGAIAKALDPGIYDWEFSPADVSQVPVPAAAWLFGSAVIGAGFFSRKKRSA
jgi:hypothetical protein